MKFFSIMSYLIFHEILHAISKRCDLSNYVFLTDWQLDCIPLLGFKISFESTLFQQHDHRLYTWKSCDGHTHNQIDYVLIQKRWKSSIIRPKTYPGADAASDQKKTKKKAQTFLTNAELKKVAARTKYITSLDTNDLNTMWEDIEAAEITLTYESVIREKKRVLEKKQSWITEDTLLIIEQCR